MASRTQFISERSVVEASYVTTIELLVLTFESRTSPASQSHMVKGDHCPHVSQQCCLLQIGHASSVRNTDSLGFFSFCLRNGCWICVQNSTSGASSASNTSTVAVSTGDCSPWSSKQTNSIILQVYVLVCHLL